MIKNLHTNSPRLGRSLLGRRYWLFSLAALPIALFAVADDETSPVAQQSQPAQLSTTTALSPDSAAPSLSIPENYVQDADEYASKLDRVAAENTQAAETSSKMQASLLLQHADESSSDFSVLGPNTGAVVSLYGLFDAAGWNDCIDGVVMKSCPEGYELFCQTRDMLFRIYEQTGGNIDPLISLFQSIDFRTPYYQWAAAADNYQNSQDRNPGGITLTP